MLQLISMELNPLECPLWVRTGHRADTWAMSASHAKSGHKRMGLGMPLLCQ